MNFKNFNSSKILLEKQLNVKLSILIVNNYLKVIYW